MSANIQLGATTLSNGAPQLPTAENEEVNSESLAGVPPLDIYHANEADATSGVDPSTATAVEKTASETPCGVSDLALDFEVVSYFEPNLNTDIEVEYPILYWKSFTCFPHLPLELRRKIWLHTLPPSRTTEFSDRGSGCRHGYRIRSDFHNDQALPVQILQVCREARQVFFEHYSCLKKRDRCDASISPLLRSVDTSTFMTMSDVKLAEPSPEMPYCSSYVDLKHDLLIIGWEIVQAILGPMVLCYLDLSSLQNLAVPAVFMRNNWPSIWQPFGSYWEIIRIYCPSLKRLTLIDTVEQRNRGQLPFRQEKTVFLPVNEDTIESLRSNMLPNTRQEPLDMGMFRTMPKSLRLAQEYQRNFRTQLNIHPKYWKQVEFSVVLRCYLIECLSTIQLKSSMLSPSRKYYTYVTLNNNIGGLRYLRFDFPHLFLLCKTNPLELPDKYEGVKELFEGYPIFDSGPTKSKYKEWPWN